MTATREWPLAKVLADPHFQTFAQPVAEWVERSRALRHIPVDLLLLQAELARQILGYQDQRREFEDQEPRFNNSSASRPDFQTGIRMARLGIRIVKDIADGIAWRALGYDRLAIRVLAKKPHTGALALDSIQAEMAAAIAHAEQTGDIVVINDLTNLLRFGDFTAVGNGQAKIAEVKSGGGSARSGKAKKQRRKLQERLDFLNTGVGVAPDGSPAVLLPTRARARSHAGEVQQLLRESAEHGSAHARLSDSLAVEVIRVPVMMELGHDHPTFHNPFQQSPRSFVHHTHKLLDVWTPEMEPFDLAPFSVFPFSAQDCAAVLTGSAWILSYCNLDNVIRCFRRRGLDAHLPPPEKVEALGGLRPGEFVYHELDAPITVGRRGGPFLEMSLGALARIYCEFLDEESVADQTEEVLDLNPDDMLSFLGVGFVNEAELWD